MQLADSQQKQGATSFFSALLDSVSQAIVAESVDGVIIYCNPAAEAVLGYAAADMVGLPFSRILPDPELHTHKTLLANQGQGHLPNNYQTLCCSSQNPALDVMVTVTPMLSHDGILIGFSSEIQAVESAGARQQALNELTRYKQNLAAIVESSDDAIISKTLEGIVTSWNKAAEKIFGYTAEEMVGQPMLKIFPPDRVEEEMHILSKLKSGEKVDHFQTIRLHKSGRQIHISVTVSPIYNAEGEIVGASKIAKDVTEKLNTEKLVWRQANYDALTNLPNRRLLMDRLAMEVSKAHREMHGLTIMFIDLDHFKEVNDSLGHNIGDELLQKVSHRIRDCFRQSDMLARFGGDEFVALMPCLNQRKDIDTVCSKLLKVLSDPFMLEDANTVYVSASIGIAVYPMDGESDQELIKHADQAMYEAKRKGRNQAKYFIPAMQTSLDKHHQLGVDLRFALQNNEFFLSYQPIVDLSNDQIVKAEALIRWNHPLLGVLAPMEFIPIAEETGIIHSLGDWVFRTAVRQLKRWQEDFSLPLQLSINKSPVQFNMGNDVPQHWQSFLQEVGLSGEHLIVEITESTMMTLQESTQNKLLSFAEAGIQVAIDDFGTGYSSLAYLNKFDIDYIKIDKAFVQEMKKDCQSFHLCEALVVMAHKLGLKVVAEGVETQEQHLLLRGMQCDYGQGYYYSKPLTHELFEQLLHGQCQASLSPA
jgi:diguanylate cyclase (GGDEF)-like protein/PAS domain S-box-containing protein